MIEHWLHHHPEQLPRFRPAILGITFVLVALGVQNKVSLVWLFAPVLLASSLMLPLSYIQVALLVGMGVLLDVLWPYSSQLPIAQSITLGSIMLLGNLSRQFLLSIEWELASRKILDAILEADSTETPSNLIRQALALLRDFARADVALALHKLDDVTAKALVCLPPTALPTQIIHPKCFACAIATNRCLYYPNYPSTPDAAPMLLALGAKSLAVLPLHNAFNQDGAVLLIWYRRTQIKPELRRFCELLLGGLRTLLRFEHTNFCLEKLQARCSAILETIPQGVVFVDESGEQGWINQAAARQLGLLPGDVEPMVLASAMAQLRKSVDNPMEIAAQAAQLFAQPDVEIRDWLWTFSDPSPKVLSISSTPTRMRDVPGRLWLLEDITERQQAQEALHESAQRDRAIARAIQRMRQTLDIDTIFTATTQEIRQVINCDRVVVYQFNSDWSGELVAESVGSGWISLVKEQPNNFNLTENAVEDERCTVKAFDNSSTLVQDTYLQETQGGAYSRGLSHVAVGDIYQAGFASCYINLLEGIQARAYIIVPIFCGSKLWGLLGAYQNSDPRQWKAAEINMVVQIGNQLAVALQQAELLAQTQRQSEALQKAAIAADTANRAKSEFVASMSHELRTPLNAILGFTQLMIRDNSLSSSQQEDLRTINTAGEHLLGLINNILEMSKIEAGRIPFTQNSFDLISLLDSLEKMFFLKAAEKGLQLQFKYGSDIPQFIKTDESKLRQVLINILGNAIKFTKFGQITLRMMRRLGNGNSLIFEIEDTGPGIAPEEIPLIFEAFGQTETGRKFQQGTGLGLAISRKYVQLMGGDIRVSSTLGKGSIFAFDIQISAAEATEIQLTPSKHKVIGLAPNQPEYRILVVDDTRESRVLLVKLFTSIGFQVREAENGREAVICWESWQPHLIFMDMRMPVMDGYEATQHIKAHLLGQATAIIALTASALEEQRKAILSSGCDDFVSKPFREEILLEKVSKHLGVRYIYAQENKNTETQRLSTQEISTIADWQSFFSQMPAEWVAQIDTASCSGSDVMIIELIKQIPEENVAFALTLKDLASNFQFEQIIKMIGAEGK